MRSAAAPKSETGAAPIRASDRQSTKFTVLPHSIHHDPRKGVAKAIAHADRRWIEICVPELHIVDHLGRNRWTLDEVIEWMSNHAPEIAQACDEQQLSWIAATGTPMPDNHEITVRLPLP